MLKRIIGAFFILVGSSLIWYANYRQLHSSSIEEENKVGEEKLPEKDSFDPILSYLREKYDEEFQVIRKEKEYCLEVGSYQLSYHPTCDVDDVKNTLYTVYSKENDLSFIVKEVVYDSKKVTIPLSEKENETLGYYDNYTNVVFASLISDSLQPFYQTFFDVAITVVIEEGIGIDRLTKENAYQYLDNHFQNASSLPSNIEEFVDKVSDHSLHITILVDEELTSQNFQNAVSFFLDFPSYTEEHLAIESVHLSYQNDRYLLYDSSLQTVELRDEKTDALLYDKVISFLDSSQYLDYFTFQNLPKENFHF